MNLQYNKKNYFQMDAYMSTYSCLLSFVVGDISGDIGESGGDIPFSLQKYGKNIKLDLCFFKVDNSDLTN